MIKKFISYYKPYIGLFIFDMSAALIMAICNLAYPNIVKSIMNDYVNLDTPDMLIIASLILLFIYLLKCVCNYIVGYLGHWLGVKMQADMRRDLFRKYESLPFSYFDKNKTGDLLSRLVNDLFDVSELAHHGPENIFLALFMLIGSFVMLVSINLTLTLVLFSVLPFIILFTVLTRRRISKVMKASRKQISIINSSLENSIGGIRETKSYAKEEFEKAKFDKENCTFASIRRQAMRSFGSFDAIMQLMQDLLYLIVVFVGGLFFFYEKIDAGEFAAFILYTSMFLVPIQRFTALYQQLNEGLSGFQRFYDIMGVEEEIDNGKTVLKDIKGDLEFKNVSFSYVKEDGERPVIKDLSLKIEAGKTLALVGPSGGGKSTLCNLIPRFYKIDAGQILIDGIDTENISLKSLRENIGSVSQNVFLFDGTVRENIAYGHPDATDEDVICAAKKAQIHEHILTMPKGYDTEVGERGIRLSGGQKQRIAIARMFLKNPKLLILDEATSALDNLTEMQIQSSLEELSVGRTVIVVAHRLSTVKRADEIIVLDKDGIVERGTHEQLIALDGEYKKLYLYQFKD